MPYQEKWENLGPINGGLAQYNVTFDMINAYYKQIQDKGFHSLSYFDIGNWGTRYVSNIWRSDVPGRARPVCSRLPLFSLFGSFPGDFRRVVKLESTGVGNSLAALCEPCQPIEGLSLSVCLRALVMRPLSRVESHVHMTVRGRRCHGWRTG